VTVTPESPAEAPPRFKHGEPVTILVTATADAQYETCAPGGTTVPVLEARLPARTMTRVTVPCENFPGVRVIPGDIRPALIRMAYAALNTCPPVIGCPDCEEGHPCQDCVLDAERRREYTGVLAALGEPPAT
jgi:hypothetical protein